MDTSKGTDHKMNEEEGAGKEVKVETVDYRSPPGENQQSHKENVEIIHEIHDGADCNPGVRQKLAFAAAKVERAVESAQEAVTGNKKENDNID